MNLFSYLFPPQSMLQDMVQQTPQLLFTTDLVLWLASQAMAHEVESSYLPYAN